VFYGCTGLSSIIVRGDIPIGIARALSYNTKFYNDIPDNEAIYLNRWAVGYKLGSSSNRNVVLKSDTVGIADAAFADRNFLSIVIPAGVVSIKDDAFKSCFVSRVYYGGKTAGEWNAISIGTGNTALSADKIYYYSETQPVAPGNYWRFVSGSAAAW